MLNFKPDFYFEKITDISPDFLLSKNIKALVLDVDNTLTCHGSQQVSDDIKNWIFKTKQNGIALIILSNNSPERVKPFADSLGIDFLTGTKPKKSDYKRVLDYLKLPPESCAGVGDQIFTDIWGANASNLTSILTKPISNEETKFIRFKRLLEKPILKGLEK